MGVDRIANVTREVGPSAAGELTIDAGVALAEMLRTTLGPNGLDKMLIGNGTIILTNDGGSIVDRMDIEFFDSHNWGYSIIELTRDDCTYVAYAVDKTVDTPNAGRSVVAAYRVPEGTVKLEDVTDEYRE